MRDMKTPLPPSKTTDTTTAAAAAATAAARWKAVVNRDTTYNNSFIYAVRSTHIYCRPGCPARLARRANIEFFDSPTTALRAGYRACKRCKPDDQQKDASSQSAMVARSCEVIAAAVARGKNPPVLRELAAEVGLTASHFHRVFKKVVGVTPGQYASGIRGVARTSTSIGTAGKTGMEGGEEEEGGVDMACDVAGFAAQFEVDEMTFDDLIDWDEFDRAMRENDAYIDRSLAG